MLASQAFAWNSVKVQYDANGRLTYPADANGNRIPDFSNAGYKGGGVPLPTVPVVKTISPISGDNTAHIQAAINEVGNLPVQANGYRGTILLNAGVYSVLGTININKSGVVLSGVGDGTDPQTNTILRRTGTSTATVIVAGGGGDDQFKAEVPNTRSNITTQRVTVGSRSFAVENGSLYAVGDCIVVVHPSTQAWIEAVNFGGVTDENKWVAGQNTIRYHRYITAISGNTITIDAPVFNHLDRALTQSYIHKYDKAAAGILNHIGIEDLLVDIVTAGETSETHCEDAVEFREADDSWIRDCTIQHFWHAGVQFVSSTRCTVERVNAIEPHSQITGGRRYNFCTYHAQLILFKDSYANNGRHCFIANGTSLDSGIVVLNCTFENTLGYSEGHRHWSTGLLADSCTIVNNDSGFAFFNRGNAGTGHGWGAAHSVIWRVSGGNRVEQPPTAQNYAIGCIGSVSVGGTNTTPGYVEGTNVTGLQPASLYLEQLAQRQAAQTVATPTFSPGTSTHNNNVTVTLATTTSGASIRYTEDGSTPSATTGTLYAGPVTVNASRTLRAIAYKSGMSNSGVASATYTMQVAPVVINPASGTYTAAQSVTLTCATSGATIRYTVDGSTPTATTGTVYSGPINVGSTTTIKAIASKTGYNPSGVTTATYTINNGSIVVSPADGFRNTPFAAAQKGTFTAQFDASASLSPSNALVGLSQGAQTAYTGIAVAVRFNPSGMIDARNGGAFTAASAIPFTAGATYRFRLVVNVPARTYSAFVRPPGGSELTIGTNLAFRTEQAGVTQLNNSVANVNATPGGTMTVSPVSITTAPTVAKLAVSGVIASADDGNVPANTIDGSLATRWSASGNPQWIRYDLGSSKTVSFVKIAWYSGNTRSTTFDIEVSSDGTNWTNVLSTSSSGTSTALETYEFTDRTARYVRIVGHGNTSNAWNSIAETEIWGF